MNLRQFIEHLQSIEREHGPDLAIVANDSNENEAYVTKDRIDVHPQRGDEPAHFFIAGNRCYIFPEEPPTDLNA